jgi:hypothetical protein
MPVGRGQGARSGRVSCTTQPCHQLHCTSLADYADRQHERGTVTRDDKNKRTVKPGANAAIS